MGAPVQAVKTVAEASTTPLISINIDGGFLTFSTLDFGLMLALAIAIAVIFAAWKRVPPQFYTKLSHALDDGNFWLAASVAFTTLAPNIDKPYSTFCYTLTLICALYGAILKTGRDEPPHDGDCK